MDQETGQQEDRTVDTLSYYRTRIGLVAPEDRVRSLRARRLRTHWEPGWELPAHRPEGRRRWSVASLVGLVVAKRDAIMPRRTRTEAATKLPTSISAES